MQVKFGFFKDVVLGFGLYNVDDFREAKILQWKVKVGDNIKEGDPLCEIETEKVTTDLEAYVAGKIISLDYEEGEPWNNGGVENTPVGELVIPALGVIEVEGDAAPGTEPETESESSPQDESPQGGAKGPAQELTSVRVTPLAREAAKELGVAIEDVLASLPTDVEELTAEHIKQFSEKTAIPGPESHQGIQAVPAARKLAKELGIDISQVKPAEGSMVCVRDVEAFAKQKSGKPEAPQDGLGAFESITELGMQSATARHMQEAWNRPHASPAVDFNPKPLFKLREELKEEFKLRHGLTLRVDHFFVAACAHLLAKPELRILNAYWHEEDGNAEIRLYNHANVGIAVGVSPEKTKTGFSGLVTPSVKRAETLHFVEIVRESERLIAAALEMKLKLQDLANLTFIVNNTGTPVEWEGKRFLGDEYPDPIIAPKTAAILAFGAPREAGYDSAKKLMNVKLRFDHRVVNGYEPKLFLRALQDLIENPQKILVLR